MEVVNLFKGAKGLEKLIKSLFDILSLYKQSSNNRIKEKNANKQEIIPHTLNWTNHRMNK